MGTDDLTDQLVVLRGQKYRHIGVFVGVAQSSAWHHLVRAVFRGQTDHAGLGGRIAGAVHAARPQTGPGAQDHLPCSVMCAYSGL